jgi:hypothetical protein
MTPACTHSHAAAVASATAVRIRRRRRHVPPRGSTALGWRADAELACLGGPEDHGEMVHRLVRRGWSLVGPLERVLLAAPVGSLERAQVWHILLLIVRTAPSGRGWTQAWGRRAWQRAVGELLSPEPTLEAWVVVWHLCRARQRVWWPLVDPWLRAHAATPGVGPLLPVGVRRLGWGESWRWMWSAVPVEEPQSYTAPLASELEAATAQGIDTITSLPRVSGAGAGI